MTIKSYFILSLKIFFLSLLLFLVFIAIWLCFNDTPWENSSRWIRHTFSTAIKNFSVNSFIFTTLYYIFKLNLKLTKVKILKYALITFIMYYFNYIFRGILRHSRSLYDLTLFFKHDLFDLFDFTIFFNLIYMNSIFIGIFILTLIIIIPLELRKQKNKNE